LSNQLKITKTPLKDISLSYWTISCLQCLFGFRRRGMNDCFFATDGDKSSFEPFESVLIDLTSFINIFCIIIQNFTLQLRWNDYSFLWGKASFTFKAHSFTLTGKTAESFFVKVLFLSNQIVENLKSGFSGKNYCFTQF